MEIETSIHYVYNSVLLFQFDLHLKDYLIVQFCINNLDSLESL